MSRGPGRVQRAILDLVATDEAMKSFNVDDNPNGGGPGPVGVPLGAVFMAVWGTDEPTRSQVSSVERAVRILSNRGAVKVYQRRFCPVRLTVDDYYPWNEETGSYDGCCGRLHRLGSAVGRLPTTEEEAASTALMGALLRLVND